MIAWILWFAFCGQLDKNRRCTCAQQHPAPKPRPVAPPPKPMSTSEKRELIAMNVLLTVIVAVYIWRHW